MNGLLEGETNALSWSYSGSCLGVKYEKIDIPPHFYSDGKPHVSKLEEKLNGGKNVLAQTTL